MKPDRMLIALLLLLPLMVAARAEVVVSTIAVERFESVDDDEHDRIGPVPQLSGDGRYLVYVVDEQGFDLSLSGWLSGRKGGWPEGSGASIRLLDLNTGEERTLYRGELSVTEEDGVSLLRTIEAGFSLEMSSDGSRVYAICSRIEMTRGDNSRIDNELLLLEIDVDSAEATILYSLVQPGFQPASIPLRVSEDSSTALFAYTPIGEGVSTTWGVESRLASEEGHLLALPLQEGAAAVVLNAEQPALIGTEDELVRFINREERWFFDLSADGERIVYQGSGNGEVVGIQRDGSGRHRIAVLPSINDAPPSAAYVSISGDGKRVAYVDRSSEDASIYVDSFDGGEPILVANQSTFAAGHLDLDFAGSALLYDRAVAGPGGSYGVTHSSYRVVTDGELEAPVEIAWGIEDTANNQTTILTGAYYSPRLQLSTLSTPLPAKFDAASLRLELPWLRFSGSDDPLFADGSSAILELTGEGLFRLVSLDQPIGVEADNAAVFSFDDFTLTLPLVEIVGLAGLERASVVLQLVDFEQLGFSIVSVSQ